MQDKMTDRVTAILVTIAAATLVAASFIIHFLWHA